MSKGNLDSYAFSEPILYYLMVDEINDINYGEIINYNVDHEEINIIKKYRSLDDNGKEIIDLLDQIPKEQLGELQNTIHMKSTIY